MTDHIIVASNLTDHSDEIVETAGSMARRLRASLTLLHVVTEDTIRHLREDLPAESAFDDAVVQRYQAELAAQADRVLGAEADVRTEVTLGEVATSVHELAERENATMIVIGIRNRSRVGKLLLGSDAQELLLDTSCPVLGVPV